MRKLPLVTIVAAGALQIACGDGAEAETADPPRTLSASGLPLGEPFEIVDGVISADSNEYGLQASLAAFRSTTGSSMELTSTTGELCFRGALARVVEGPFGPPFAAMSFITGRNVVVQLPQVGATLNLGEDPHALEPFYGAATGIIIDPAQQEPWNLGGGRVIGIEVTVTGPNIPVGAPGFGANPGGLNPDEVLNQYGTVCDGSIPPSSGERTVEGLFSDLHYFCWDTAQLPFSGWTANSTIIFGWGAAGSRIPNTPENANAAPILDPYDFCLSDIRPILANAPPQP